MLFLSKMELWILNFLSSLQIVWDRNQSTTILRSGMDHQKFLQKYLERNFSITPEGRNISCNDSKIRFLQILQDLFLFFES